MDTITINEQLYNAMLDVYTKIAFSKICKDFSCENYVRTIACRTASEFDKNHGIENIENILDFVILQFIICVATDDKSLKFDNIINDIINEYTFDDKKVASGILPYAMKKMEKIQKGFGDLKCITDAFIKIVTETNI